MKTKQIYEIALKIGGIVAAWKFIESLILFGIIFITYNSIPFFDKIRFWNIVPVNNVSIYLIGAYALFAFLLLFRTEKAIKMLRLNQQDDVDLPIERKELYHILVLAVGFSMLIYSANHIASKTYSTSENTTSTITNQPVLNTMQIHRGTNPNRTNVNMSTYSSKTTTTTSSNSSSKSTTTKNDITTSYNYVSVMLLLISLVMIFKSVRISEILLAKIKDDEVST